jgi:hypothetical protein
MLKYQTLGTVEILTINFADAEVTVPAGFIKITRKI